MNRIIKLTVALVLALSGFLVAGGASTAQASDQGASLQKAPASVRRANPPRTSVVIHAKRKTRVAFKVWAKISPAGGKKRVKLQYAHKLDGHYKTVRRDKMNKRGRADFGRISKVGYYRVLVPRSKHYARTISPFYLYIHRIF